MREMLRSRARQVVLIGLSGLWLSGAADAANLVDLPVLTSTSGVLDVLMVARPATASTLTPLNPTSWVYDICPRPANGALSCPTTTANLYGGTRLQLAAGDTLKVRLVNLLPLLPEAAHAAEAGNSYLKLNPTNIHTHGLLVSPRYPTTANPTYGDNVLVLTLNTATGSPSSDAHVHGDTRLGYTDYSIKVPAGHPSGMYWFHPHVHGVSLNQVSGGLSGMITVGSVLDYVCKGKTCANFAAGLPVRHLLLKDTQVLSTGKMQTQQDPDFCLGNGASQGYCAGSLHSDDSGAIDSRGGRWFFTVNGQPYPNVPVTNKGGEIWRLTAASGSATYNLHLQDTAVPANDMTVQVLSIDGVAVQGPKTGSVLTWLNLNRQRGNLVPCPGINTTLSNLTTGAPVCAKGITMMPSSRVELWVAYRDAAGNLVTPIAGTKAVLRTVGYASGPEGDTWPAVDLAQVTFSGSARVSTDPIALEIGGTLTALLDQATLATAMKTENAAVGTQAGCTPLAAGHGRRIFYGNTAAGDFGLGYEEIDAYGVTVPGTFVDVKAFDPDTPTICVSLATGNTTNTEVWQLVNLAGEDHNFHIHQLRFKLLNDPNTDGSTTLRTLDSSAIAYDNLPLRHGSASCNTVQAWRDSRNPFSAGYKACDGAPVTVAIPFSIAGDFVYHCHILEHEDGGMMARIRVRASAN
ncbi:MAG: multicopper oxidase domain-containing protein [Burkholderiales bacterium]|nr:multicopper oxidase domain-containing protein [Burkholderiales bacterium]